MQQLLGFPVCSRLPKRAKESQGGTRTGQEYRRKRVRAASGDATRSQDRGALRPDRHREAEPARDAELCTEERRGFRGQEARFA